MYLPSATVERTPVAKTIANAARLSRGELLFSTLSPLRYGQGVRISNAAMLAWIHKDSLHRDLDKRCPEGLRLFDRNPKGVRDA
ncbi:hypothetical protein QF000_001973 [Paraburkholderia atlantica]